MNLFCNHEWKTLEHYKTESDAEQAIRLARECGAKSIQFPHNYTHFDICILACVKCGKMYVERQRNDTCL